MSVHKLSHQAMGSWRTASLNELGQLYCGQSPASSTVNTNGLGTLYVSGPEQWDGHKIRQDKWTNDPKRLVPDGCIFITVKGAGVGKIFPGISCAIGRDVYAFKPKAKLSAKFIEHAIRFTVQDVLRHAVGDIPGLSKAHILQHEIGLPEPQEQERIVAELEKQFSRLDEAVANLKRVKANLKRYKAAVLKAAVEGKLTEDWRKQHPDVEPANKLLERILAERLAKWNGRGEHKEAASPDTGDLPGLPISWKWATVDQLSMVVRGASPRPAGDSRYFGGIIPWITVGPITADQKPYLTSVPESVTEAGRERSRYIESHTLLLTNSGATLGVPKITLIGGCINDGVAALLDVGYPLKLYLLYFLHTQTTQLRRVNQGAAQPNLNTSIIKAINVPLPPHDEQEQVVAEVERRLSVIEELEAAVQANLIRSDRLRQSILSSIFSGKLFTRENPSTRSGDNNVS